MKFADSVEGKDKEKRRGVIRRIISQERIRTQNELSERLEQEGFQVTQATVSRDIRELRLVKVSDRNGHYYAETPSRDKYHASDKFKAMYRGNAEKVERAQNLVVIRTPVGMAQAVCATMDSIEWPGVIGTLAGDDTVLIIAADEVAAKEVVSILKEI